MFLRNLLLILLILQPFADKLTKKAGIDVNILNELLSIAVFLGLIVVFISKKKMNNLFLVLAGFFTYCVLLVIYRGIYPLGFFQIIIYFQFFFYFFYFHSLTLEQKTKTILSYKNIFSVFIWVMGIIGVFEALDHSTFRQFLGVHSVKRGINYFYIISFFGSGPSVGIFTMMYVLLWHYVHYALNIKVKTKHIITLLLAIVIGALSFSRKEVFFTFVFLIFFPYPSRNQLNKWIKRLLFFSSIFAGLFIYYISFFETANSSALDGKYIRWKIIRKATEVYKDHIPFGSGPGTFGSKVSLSMRHIYEKYNVGQDMLGWEVLNSRGPIYDAFLFTFFTEIGIGILFFFFFVYKLFEARTILDNPFSKFSKNFILFFMVALSVFVPMFTNNFGYIIMALVAMMIGPISIFKYRKWYA